MAKRTSGGHILLVDDEEGIRATLPPILMDRGFAVTAVGNISDALAQVNRRQYDVLLSDLNIEKPGDGFLVIAAMHLLQPRCVNLVLTGYPTLDTAIEGLRQGIADYFVKPVEIEELVKAISQKLKTRRSRRMADLPEPKRKMHAGTQ
jgi:DNA-binding NtrC family response regulator